MINNVRSHRTKYKSINNTVYGLDKVIDEIEVEDKIPEVLFITSYPPFGNG